VPARHLPVLLAVAALAACGGSGTRAPTAGERQWLDNGARLIDGLLEDVRLSSAGGTEVADARRALHSDSQLYAMLVAYTAFGGCRGMLARVGEAEPGLRPVERRIAAACVRVERAAALFERAVSSLDPRTLVEATRTAAQAFPLLLRARAELAAARAGIAGR